MASERQDNADRYEQAGREMAERHEQELRKQKEEHRKQREEMKRTLQFETKEHRDRMRRIVKEQHARTTLRLEKEQREEIEGERESLEMKQARKDLQRQADEKEKEMAQAEQEFADDRAYVNEQIDQLIEEAERKETQQREWAEKRGIDPAEAARPVRREYEEKIRKWEKHHDQWAEKTQDERNRLLEQLDRSVARERDIMDRDKSNGWDRSR